MPGSAAAPSVACVPSPNTPDIVTDRLRFVRAKPEEADALFAIFMGQASLPSPPSAADLRRRIEGAGWEPSFNPSNNIPFSIFMRDTLVGWLDVQFSVRQRVQCWRAHNCRTVEMEAVLSPSVERGRFKEAHDGVIERYNPHGEIQQERERVRPDNTPAISAVKKCGQLQEYGTDDKGHLVFYEWFDDGMTDENGNPVPK